MSEERRQEQKRTRRTAYQKGRLHIPQGVLPADRHHRLVRYTGPSISKVRALGYEPVSKKDKRYEQVCSYIGDGTAADASKGVGDYIIIDDLILVECPIELWEQAQKEKAASAQELEDRYKKPAGDGFVESRVSTTVDKR